MNYRVDLNLEKAMLAAMPIAFPLQCSTSVSDLHNISFSQYLTVRRRTVYEKKPKHGMSMTCPKASTPRPAHSSTGLSKHSHAASHAGLGVAEPRSPKALGIYLT